MFQNVKVIETMEVQWFKKQGWFGQCNMKPAFVIKYHDDKANTNKYAACVEGLRPKKGDVVEIYRDEEVHYKGYSCMALKIIR